MNIKKILESLGQLPSGVLIIFANLLVLGTALCLVVSQSWATRVDYSFGYFAPIFALYVIYDRRAKIFAFFKNTPETINAPLPNRAAEIAANTFFGTLFAGGAAVYAMFAFTYFISRNWGAGGFGMTLGFCALSPAMCYFASGFAEKKSVAERIDFTMLFTFPCLIWLVATPMFGVFESMVSLFLLSKVAIVVSSIMDFLGYIAELRGNTIVFPNGSVGVADACSGIRSLTACLFAGSFLAAIFFEKLWKKVALVGLSMCCAFFNNLLRALFLSFWAYENGPDSISGFVHDAAGYAILIMTVIELLMLMPLFQLNPVPPEFRNKSPDFIAENDDSDK